jgi:hypothetical protein
MATTAARTEHAGLGVDKRRATTSTVVVEGLLWLFVLNLGIALGAGLYEARIVVPSWLSYSPDNQPVWNAAAAREANTGLRFWVYVTTGPLTLLTLASLIAVWWTRGAVRTWWLTALGAALVDRVMTLTYFIPTMVRLTNETMPAPEAAHTAMQWMSLNNVRHLATAVALLAALRTFALFYAERGRASVEGGSPHA